MRCSKEYHIQKTRAASCYSEDACCASWAQSLCLSQGDALTSHTQAAPGVWEAEAAALCHLPSQLLGHCAQQGRPAPAPALAGPSPEAHAVSVHVCGGRWPGGWRTGSTQSIPCSWVSFGREKLLDWKEFLLVKSRRNVTMVSYPGTWPANTGKPKLSILQALGKSRLVFHYSTALASFLCRKILQEVSPVPHR